MNRRHALIALRMQKKQRQFRVIKAVTTKSAQSTYSTVKDFPLRARTRQERLLSPLLFNLVLEVLTRIRQEKVIKGREGVKLSVCR